MDDTAWLSNNAPRKATGLSPNDLWTKTRIKQAKTRSKSPQVCTVQPPGSLHGVRESERRSRVINETRSQTETFLQEDQQTLTPQETNPEVHNQEDRTELQRGLPLGSGNTPGSSGNNSNQESKQQEVDILQRVEEEVVTPRRSERTHWSITQWTADW
eukprot:7569459-Ditylum_brightwellii.AAC.1